MPTARTLVKSPPKSSPQSSEKTPEKRLAKTVDKAGYAAPDKPSPQEFRDARIAILATRWNVDIVDALLAGTRRCLKAWGVPRSGIAEFRAPGAFELPLAASALMSSGRYHGVVVLGAVIRGDTPHFEFVAGECARGLREAAQQHRVALGFGVLTVNTAAQAQERAGRGDDNKGFEAAAATLEMIRLLRVVDGDGHE